MRERRIVTPWRIHTSRLRENRGPLLSSTIRFTGEEVSLRSPLRSSSGNSSRCRQPFSAELCGRRGWFTLCFVSGNRGRLQRDSAPASLRTRPAASTLQTIAVVESQFSWTFPAHPRSLASVLIPRPAALGVLLRSLRRTPFGSGFPNKNPPRNQRAAAAQSAGWIFLRSLRRKTRPRRLGAGHLASLRAIVSRR